MDRAWQATGHGVTELDTTVHIHTHTQVQFKKIPDKLYHHNRLDKYILIHSYKTSLVAQMVKHLPTMWETWVSNNDIQQFKAINYRYKLQCG